MRRRPLDYFRGPSVHQPLRHELPYAHPAAQVQVQVTQGQRVVFQTRPGTTLLDTTTRYPLIRAQRPDIALWTLTMAPLFRATVGPSSDGLTVGALNASPRAYLTFGGGGVSYQTSFDYPANGASIAVAGDTVSVDVRAQDGAGAYPQESLVAAVAWATPDAASESPLIVGNFDRPFVSAQALPPFARALLVGFDTAGATAVVTFTGPLGASTTLVAAPGVSRIPVPAGAGTYAVTVSAGNVHVDVECSFT